MLTCGYVSLLLSAMALVATGACGTKTSPPVAAASQPAPVAASPQAETITPIADGPLTLRVDTLALVGEYPMFVLQIRNNTPQPIRVSQCGLMTAFSHVRLADSQGRDLQWVLDRSGILWQPADNEHDFVLIRPCVPEAFQIALLPYSDLTLTDSARETRTATASIHGTVECSDANLNAFRTIPLKYSGTVSLLLPPTSAGRDERGANGSQGR